MSARRNKKKIRETPSKGKLKMKENRLSPITKVVNLGQHKLRYSLFDDLDFDGYNSFDGDSF